jgi:integrase
MPRVRLTQTVVDKLGARAGEQRLVWDRSLPGFGVLVSGRTNTKSYVVKGRVGGRTVRRKIGRADVMSLVAARAEAKKVMLGLAAGIDPRAKKASAATLGAILETYVSLASLAPRTAASYREAVARYFADWRDRPIGAITRDMVEKRHRAIAAEVAARDRAENARAAKRHLLRAERAEPHSAEAAARHRALAEAAREREPRNGFAAANGAMRTLRLLWNFAADKDDKLGANPVKLKKNWFEVHPREDLVKADDMARFYEAVTALKNPVARDFLLTALFTGCRRRELAGLKWADVDFKAGVIRLPAATTKSGRKFDVPMSDVVRDLLVARRALAGARFVFSPAPSRSGHIEEPKSALAEVAATSGVRVSCHGLRRSYASVAEAIVSGIELKCLLNHAIEKKKDATAGYIVVGSARLREAAQKVADRLATLCGIAAEPNVARLRRRENRDA